MRVTLSPSNAKTPTAVALGNFDGVHRGHRQVIKPVLPESSVDLLLGNSAFSLGGNFRLESNGFENGTISENWNRFDGLNFGKHLCATAVTFNPHPREFFTGQTRYALTPPDEKASLLHLLGVEQLVMLPFDREMASLSPQEFVEKILVQQLKAFRVSVGEDFCFGQRRSGTSADLRSIAAKYNVEVIIVPIQYDMSERISTSIIRSALQMGDLDRANQLLGRSYTLIGWVVKGQQLGRTLGFPTANLQLPKEKFLPRFGVYAVRVFIEEELDREKPVISQPIPTLGVANIGCRPTVNGSSPTVEVHLLDWCGDLYGKTLTVSLEKFLRPEQKFASLSDLKAQIQVDCATAKSVIG